MLSVVAGFGSIGFLSSVFAKIQGVLFPRSLQLFELPAYTSSDRVQLIIKLLCIYFSCVLGGLITSGTGGKVMQHYLVGGGIFVVVGWLWMSTVDPWWFWTLLISGVLPLVVWGGKIGYALRGNNK